MEPIVTSALISSGASLLGGLFGGGKKKTTKREVDYKKLVKNAQAAGFNPLTALRNGGAAGFAQTTDPGLSSSMFLADAIGNVGSAMAEAPLRQRQKERENLRDELIRAQIDNTNAQTRFANQPRVDYVNSVENRGPTNPSLVNGESGAGSSGTGYSAGVDITQSPERMEAPSLIFSGSHVPYDLGTSNTEEAEQRYGDIVGTAWGVGTAYNDLGKTPIERAGQKAHRWVSQFTPSPDLRMERPSMPSASYPDRLPDPQTHSRHYPESVKPWTTWDRFNNFVKR